MSKWIRLKRELLTNIKVKKALKKALSKEFYNELYPRSDKQIIQISLDYAYHRLKKHNNSGIEGLLDIEEVDDLRERLRQLSGGELVDI